MSLTTCLKRAGAALDPEDRLAVLSRASELRAAGRSTRDAGIEAVSERLDAVKAMLEAFPAVAQPAQAVDERADDVIRSAMQSAMSKAGWTAEVGGPGNTIWTKRRRGERYTANLLEQQAGRPLRMEVTVLAEGGVDVGIGEFDVTDANDAAAAADRSIANSEAESGSAGDTVAALLPSGTNVATIAKLRRGDGQEFLARVVRWPGRNLGPYGLALYIGSRKVWSAPFPRVGPETTKDELVAGFVDYLNTDAASAKEKYKVVGEAQGRPALELEAPTPEQLQANADRADAAQRADADRQRELANRARADAEREEFVLTGSDRPADVAAAAGQGGLFDAPATGDEPADNRKQGAAPLRDRVDAMRQRAQPGVVENFGEELPPARRNLAAKLDEDLKDEDIAKRPLSELWPLAENEAIEDTFAAAVAHAARAEIPAKPRQSYKLRRWVEAVKMLRGLAGHVVGARLTPEKLADAVATKYGSLKDWHSKVQLLQLLPRDQWKRVGEVEPRPEAFTYGDDGKRVVAPMLRLTIDGRSHWLSGDGTVDGTVDAIRKLLAAAEPEKRMQFEVRGSGPYKINKKGDPEYRALMTFATAKEAFEAIKSDHDGLAAAWEQVKARDNVTERDVRSAENRPRSGKDHRGEVSRLRVVQALIKSADADAKALGRVLVGQAGAPQGLSNGNVPGPFGLSDWPSDAGSVNANARQRSSYMAAVGLHLLRNVSETEALAVQLRGERNVPLVAAVQEAMIALGHDAQVLRAVVQRVPVDVVDFLAGKQLAPESLFRDKAVLKSLLPVQSGMSVGRRGDDPVLRLVRAIAGPRAEVSGADDPARVSLEGDAALVTGKVNSGLEQALFSQDVSPEEFQSAFSFKGGEFGKWVKQGAGDKERQAMLNSAYDALMDLAEIVGVPPRAISLNGTLGIAFGSRGSGWASAHFEPSNLVINLTKTRGAGALAHEWFHALDNYFSRLRRDGAEVPFTGDQTAYRTQNFITHKPEALMVRKDGSRRSAPMTRGKLEAMHEARKHLTDEYNPEKWESQDKQAVRPEVEQRFVALVQALKDSPMARRAALLDKGGGYWSRTLELAARAFENFVQARMMEQGYHNDFLANVVPAERFARDLDRYPYLLAGEVKPIAEAFDALFSEIKTRETPGGVALYEPGPQDYSAPYETDLFGQPLPAPTRGADRGRGRRAAVADRNVDPAAPVPGEAVEAPAGQYATRTALVTTRQQQLGANAVRSLADSANALAYLRRSAVERLDAIVTDDKGKPLAVIGGFKGALAETSVYPATIVGEAILVPGARQVWLVHNHPSGKAELSRGDRAVADKVWRAFDGTRIKAMGMVAVAGGRWTGAGASDRFDMEEGGTLSPVDGVTVKAQERQLVVDATMGPAVESPADAKRAVADIVRSNMGRPTIVLLDYQHQPVAAVPWSAEDAMPMRDNGKIDALLRAVAASNAGAALIGTGGPMTSREDGMTLQQAQNIGAGLAKMDVRVLDIIDRNGGSAAEMGLNTSASVLYTSFESRPYLAGTKYAEGPASHMQAMADAVEVLGFDPAVPVLNERVQDGPPMRYSLQQRAVYYNTAAPHSRVADVQYMIEELLHAVDHVGGERTISASNPRFMPGGDLRTELEAAYQSSAAMRDILAHPLDENVSDTVKAAELFARAGTLYHANPNLLQATARSTYEAFSAAFGVPGSRRGVQSQVQRRAPVAPAQVGESDGGRNAGSGARDAGSDGQGRADGLGRVRQRVLQALGGTPRGAVVDFGVAGGNPALFSTVDATLSPADTATYGRTSPDDRRAVGLLQAGLNRARPDLVLDAVPARAGAAPGQPLQGADRARVAAAELAKRLFDKQVTYFRSSAPLANGVYQDAQPGRIFLWQDARRPHMAVLGHELLHAMRADRPDLYDTLKQRVLAVAKDLDQRDLLLQLTRLKSGLPKIEQDTLTEEFIADVVGDRFMEPEFWQAMAKDQPGAFKRVAEAVMRFLDDVLAQLADVRPFGTDAYLSDIRAARAAVADALRNYSGGEVGQVAAQAEGDILFSLENAGQSPRTAQDLLKPSAGVFDFNRLGETKQDRIRTVIDKSRPFWLGALTRDQIADIYGKEIPQIKEYDTLTRAMENERSRMAQDAEALYEQWAKLSSELGNRLARMMLDATVFQVHPDRKLPPKNATEEQRLAHARLRSGYVTMPAEGQAMYTKVRDFHTSTLVQLKAALEGRIDRLMENGADKAAALADIRARFDQYLKNGPYFPLSRFGEFIVVANRESDGERVVAAYETAGEQMAAARTLQADGFTTKLKAAKDYNRSRDGAAGKFIGDVLVAIDKMDLSDGSRSPGAAKEQLLDDLNQLFIRALPDLSYRKHFAHRKNTPGFASDVMRGFASSAFYSASHIAKLNHSDKMTAALDGAFKAIDEASEGDYNQASQVINEMASRHEAMLNPSSHPLSNLATQAGFVMYLGLSPAAGLINMLQVPMVALPHLGARFGFAKAASAMSKAYADIMGAKANRKSGFDAAESPKLSKAEREAIALLQSEGVIDLTQAHDLAAATDRDVGSQARSKASFAIARAMRIVGWTFHVPEVMNRQVTALMTYRMEVERGGSNEAALEAAREAIKRTQFDYSSSNRARYMQGNVARVVLQFKQFSQNMTYFLGRAAYQALKGESQEVRRIARRQIVSTFAITGAMAGSLGLPGAGFVGALVGALANALGDEDDPWDWEAEYRNMLADTFGKEAGEVLSKGVPRVLMPAIDISNRVSLSDLWWRPSGREGQSTRESFASDMTNILGPTAGTILGWYTAADHMSRGNYSRAVESIVPKFIRDPLKAYRERTEGVTSYNGEPLLDTTTSEDIGRLLGFAPARASEMYEGRNAVMNAKTRIEERRQSLLSQMVKARMDNDAESRAEIQQEIFAFNKLNPEFAISGSNVVRAILNKRRNRADTEDGILLPRTKNSLRDEGRFAVIE
jgi:hypothetical protein